MSRLETDYGPIIGDVADTKTTHAKPLKPNAASTDEVEAVQKRLDALGIELSEAVEAAELSRTTYFRFKNGQASRASLRKLEDWILREETRKPPQPAKALQTKQSEWAALGAAFADEDPALFDTMLDGLRDLVKAERDKVIAIGKMLHSATKR